MVSLRTNGRLLFGYVLLARGGLWEQTYMCAVRNRIVCIEKQMVVIMY